MPKIFDNIENYFAKGLTSTLEQAYRADFCVDYFNRRGRRWVADYIDGWNGDEDNLVHGNEESVHRTLFF